MSTTKRDWFEYNEVKTRRFQTFLSLLLLILDTVPLPSLYKGKGRRPTPTRDILICLSLKIYYKTSYRDLIGELKQYKNELGLVKVPHFNTLRRYMVDPKITVILGILLVFLVQPIAVLETVFASDATGFGTSRKSEYFTVVINSQAKKDAKNKKLLQKKKKKDFVKLHVTIGTFSQMVICAVSTLNELLFKVLAYNLCRLGEVAFYMKININSSFLCHNNVDTKLLAMCVLPQKANG